MQNAGFFHHGITHSLGAALIVSSVVTACYWIGQVLSTKFQVPSTTSLISRMVRGTWHVERGTQSCKLKADSRTLGPGSWVLGPRYINLFLLTFCVYCSHIVLDIVVGSVKGMPILWPFYTPRFFASPYLRQDPFELLSATGFAKELVSSECVRRFVYESMLVYIFWAGSKVWTILNKQYSPKSQDSRLKTGLGSWVLGPGSRLFAALRNFLVGTCSVIYYGIQFVILRLRAGIRRPYSLARVAVRDPALIQGLFFLHSCVYLFFSSKK
ncbi:MAG: metal-dependent hydrolase [Candidatus Omnitrophica bacterium]|nr:metal-dependent hydrolase [Candidatus Omnitrophota bacterium]MDD5670468.1 metal-dependent hydrolase [Candidatus Omnitrophota bacterium]